MIMMRVAGAGPVTKMRGRERRSGRRARLGRGLSRASLTRGRPGTVRAAFLAILLPLCCCAWGCSPPPPPPLPRWLLGRCMHWLYCGEWGWTTPCVAFLQEWPAIALDPPSPPLRPIHTGNESNAEGPSRRVLRARPAKRPARVALEGMSSDGSDFDLSSACPLGRFSPSTGFCALVVACRSKSRCCPCHVVVSQRCFNHPCVPQVAVRRTARQIVAGRHAALVVPLVLPRLAVVVPPRTGTPQSTHSRTTDPSTSSLVAHSCCCAALGSPC